MPIPLQQQTKVLKCCDNQRFVLLSVQTHLSHPFTTNYNKNRAGYSQPSCDTLLKWYSSVVQPQNNQIL